MDFPVAIAAGATIGGALLGAGATVIVFILGREVSKLTITEEDSELAFDISSLPQSSSEDSDAATEIKIRNDVYEQIWTKRIIIENTGNQSVSDIDIDLKVESISAEEHGSFSIDSPGDYTFENNDENIRSKKIGIPFLNPKERLVIHSVCNSKNPKFVVGIRKRGVKITKRKAINYALVESLSTYSPVFNAILRVLTPFNLR